MRSEGVRSLQCPSGAVCAAASLVCIAHAECAGSFGGSDSHFAKEAACISHIIGEDIRCRAEGHKSYLEDDSVVKFTKIQTCELLDLFETVNQSVPVNEQLT